MIVPPPWRKTTAGACATPAAVFAHCTFTPRSASTYMRLARDHGHLPQVDETSCRAALRALTRKPEPRQPPRPRPTAREVAGYMAEFDVAGKLEDVIRFLRVLGVRVWGHVEPPEPAAEQIGSSGADLPTADPIALADPGPLPSDPLGAEPSALAPCRPEVLLNPTAPAPWAPPLSPPPAGRRLQLTQRGDGDDVSPPHGTGASAGVLGEGGVSPPVRASDPGRYPIAPGRCATDPCHEHGPGG